MEKQQLESVKGEETVQIANERPAYEAPQVTVMDEADVLRAFQFTSAGITWWTM